MIRFNSETLKVGNLHSSLNPTDGELMRQETYFWGLRGTSEIRSFPGAYDVQMTGWIHDLTFAENDLGRAGLIAYLRKLRLDRGKHGFLEEKMADGVAWESWSHATFLGFEAITLPGQEHGPQPVPDESRCILNVEKHWVIQGVFRWRVLRGEYV